MLRRRHFGSLGHGKGRETRLGADWLVGAKAVRNLSGFHAPPSGPGQRLPRFVGSHQCCHTTHVEKFVAAVYPAFRKVWYHGVMGAHSAVQQELSSAALLGNIKRHTWHALLLPTRRS